MNALYIDILTVQISIMCPASLKAMAQICCKVLEYHIIGKCLINSVSSLRDAV